MCVCARADTSCVATDIVVLLKKPFQLITSIGNSTERSGTAMPDKSFLSRGNRLHSNARLTPILLCLYHEERKSKSIPIVDTFVRGQCTNEPCRKIAATLQRILSVSGGV